MSESLGKPLPGSSALTATYPALPGTEPTISIVTHPEPIIPPKMPKLTTLSEEQKEQSIDNQTPTQNEFKKEISSPNNNSQNNMLNLNSSPKKINTPPTPSNNYIKNDTRVNNNNSKNSFPSPDNSPSIGAESPNSIHNEMTNQEKNNNNNKKHNKKMINESVFLGISGERKVRDKTWHAQALRQLEKLSKQLKIEWSYFSVPVDEVKHTAPNYHIVCPFASDFGTICKKLKEHKYTNMDEFLRECELVFINARMYNSSSHFIHSASLLLEKQFKVLMNNVVRKYGNEYGSKLTLIEWNKSVDNYLPFAVTASDDEDFDIE